MGRMEQLTKVFDRAWEDLLYDRCTELPTLLDVDEIDARWIGYLKPLLGFTDDISLPADTTELRRILRQAPAFWAKKPAEEAAVLFAIRMVTGNRFRAANFFDFRMQTDKTVITEELEDFDPYAISFPTNKWTGTNGVLGEAGPDFFNLNDAPSAFSLNSEWGWITIEDPTYPANDGIYPVKLVTVGTRLGRIYGTWAVSHAQPVVWTLHGWAAEYLTEARLVDHGVGTLVYKGVVTPFAIAERVVGQSSGAVATITAINTVTQELSLKLIVGRFEDNERLLGDVAGDAFVSGELAGVLNRELLRILMDLVRPFGERIDVVYVNFIDQFLTPGDLDQWEITGAAEAPQPGGYVVIGAGSRIADVDPYHADWGDQVTAWKFHVTEADAAAEFRFFVQDANNFYYVLVDYAAKVVELWKMVAGTPTQIGASASVPILKAGVSEVLRVDALAESGDTRVRVKIAGATRLDEAISPAAFIKGGIAVAANTRDLYLEVVEVNVLPTEIDRVGPNP